MDILAVGSSNWHVQKAFFDSLSEKEKVRGLINAAQGCLRDSLQNQADTIAPDGQIPPTQQPTGRTLLFTVLFILSLFSNSPCLQAI